MTTSSSFVTFTPDPHLLSLLKAVAKGTLCSDDMKDTCLYCSYAAPFTDLEAGDDPAHDADCPVVYARQMLHLWGFSLYVYCVSCERQRVTAAGGWHPLTWHTVAYEEEEARAQFLAWIVPHTVRAIQVTPLREILPPPPQESSESESEEPS